MKAEVAADPFGELSPPRHRRRYVVLGAKCEFQSDHLALLRVAEAAFGGLPSRRARGAPLHTLRLILREPAARASSDPSCALPLLSGAGLLGAMSAGSSCAMLSPATRAGLVCVSRSLLDDEYLLRYELIEMAALTLLTRTRRLVPLHAACVAAHGRALLVLGSSGAGKSTLCLRWMSQGHALLSEDGVFIEPRKLVVRGVSPWLHLRDDTVRFADVHAAAAIRRAPRIRRRSGVEKFEFDLRRRAGALSPDGLALAGVVRLSSRPARAGELLARVDPRELRADLGTAQAYAAGQPGWRDFLSRLSQLPLVELRRGAHPDDGVRAIEAWSRELG